MTEQDTHVGQGSKGCNGSKGCQGSKGCHGSAVGGRADATHTEAATTAPAPTAGPQLTAAQQRAAVERIGENLALRSGAGCGKTYVLARRFTELLMATKADANPLSRLVALTFTDKAALEMTDRVRRMLGDFAARATGQDRALLLGWLEEVSDARISTIHGFCAALLRTCAVEAGVDPAFTVCADALVAGQMLAESADQALLAAVEAQRTDAATLLASMSFAQAVELIQGLLGKRTSFDLAKYVDPRETLKRWRSLLDDYRSTMQRKFKQDDALHQAAEKLAQLGCETSADALLPLRNGLVSLAATLRNDPHAWTTQTFDAIAEVTPGRSGSDKAWGCKGSAKACRDAIKALQERLADYAPSAQGLGEIDNDAADMLANLCRLALDAAAVYDSAKTAAGLLDFDDLLLHTHRLLRTNESLRQSLAAQIDQLLIDECQDTDSIQLELLGMLVGLLPRDGDSQKAAAAPEGVDAFAGEGRLFVVGDAKQSIYRFRGAQVEVFEDLCRQIGSSRQESLDVSFRTHRAGTEFVNELFAPMMGDDYEPIGASRTNTPPHPSVEIVLARPKAGDSAAQQAQQGFDDAQAAVVAQAAVTAQRIREMIDGQEQLVWDGQSKSWRAVQAGDIAILFARMTNSLDFERELARRDIPYYVVAGTGFFQQQEVFDILNALQAVDNPCDDIALIGVLRSSLLGLDDNAIMHITQAGKPPYFRSLTGGRGTAANIVAVAPVPGLDESAQRSLGFAVNLLADLHARKDSMGIDAIIQSLLDAVGYEATLLAWPNGKRMLGNVKLLQERARGAAGMSMSLADFVSQMGEMVLNESRYEQAAVEGQEQNVVRLMTIHKAKGLEFPVVFVPDLNADRQPIKGNLLARRDWGLTYNLRPDDEESGHDKPPLAYRIAKSLEDADQQREDIRKFYVALTRHEDHLVLVGADWRAGDGEFRASGGFLRKMDEVLGFGDLLESSGNDAGNAKGITRDYANGQYRMLLRLMRAEDPARSPRERSAGQKILAGASNAQQLSNGIGEMIAERQGQLALCGTTGDSLVGPLSPQHAQLEIAVTALGDFEKCPMLFHWRHELKVPSKFLRPQPAPAAQEPPAQAHGKSALDAATMGTVFHRCMELMEFVSDSADQARYADLVRRALAEMEIEDAQAQELLTAELGQMAQKLQAGPLWQSLCRAKDLRRELDFVLQWPGVTLRGQIDLIYQDDRGGWHIVDYKSDRVGAEGVAPHAAGYELQMLVYCAAASQHLGHAVGEATLYFLRNGQTHVFEARPDAIHVVRERVKSLASQLAIMRRSGNYDMKSCESCKYCLYRQVCSCS